MAGTNVGERRRAVQPSLLQVERRQWWLWSSAILVTLLLTLGIVSFALPVLLAHEDAFYSFYVRQAVHGLVGLVLLFDIFAIYQQLQIQRIRRDLTEREKLFTLISENAADMIAVVDTNGRRLYNSPAYQKVLGYSAEELKNVSGLEQIHPEDRPRVIEAAEQAQSTGVGRRVEYRMRHKNGAWRTLESTASVIPNAQGEPEKLVIVNRDITERKQLEQQLYLSQKLEAVGRLSGGVAHDFNNLLGVIIGYGEALQKCLGAEDPLRECVDEIYKAGQRAASLTRQLLAFSRQQVLEPKVLDLNAVVSDFEKMLQRLIGEDVRLTTALSPDLGRVKADPGQLEQVIMNLAVNARDAMPQGGTLTVETSNSELDEAHAWRFPYVVPGHYVMLAVSDTGCGMDAETQAHIFEPFFTTKEKGKGTGLGLATVYGVIKQSGGYIWVESEPGKGTTFRIYFPRVEEAIQATEEKMIPIERARGSQTVLLVEDEPSLRRLTCNLLKEVGYTVLEADSGTQAIEIARQYRDSIHLLLTDVVMPGMSGHVLAGHLVPLRPEMKVLYMSGYTDHAIAHRGVLEPGTMILRKPFTRDELTRKVDEVLAVERV